MSLLLLIVVGVLGVAVVDIERESDAVRRQTALAVSADGPTRLLISLQDEQAWAAVELIGQGDQAEYVVEGYEETRRRTDTALEGFEQLLERSPDVATRAFAPAMESLADNLAALRDRIDTDPAGHTLYNLPLSNAVFFNYHQLIEPFFGGITEVASAIEHSDLRQGADLIDLTTRQVTTLGLLGREVGVTALLGGGFDSAQELVAVSTLRAQFVSLAEEIRALSSGPYEAAGDDELLVGFPDAIIAQVDAAVAGTFDTAAFLDTITPPPERTYQAYRERVADILRDRAERVGDAAARDERLYLGLTGVTGVLAVGIMLVVAGSITRPLRSLAQQVTHVAHHGLRQSVDAVLRTPLGVDVRVPDVEEITVGGDEQVRQVAAVMNTVQHAVVDLAVEQALLRRNIADSFLSMGHRQQNLLSRQLEFISQLQQDEIDPDTLGNLFELDHLATRMRRNAESLLVLAGVTAPRKWQAPVNVADIVRAAVSEVEDYRRVHLDDFDPYTVLGTAAVDLIHLLAELIENALQFSPQADLVHVRGQARPDGYVLVVIDNGLGMPPPELARANGRLSGSESFTVAPSKYLGHYVTGQLAQRHNIGVQLHHSAGSGIAAAVYLPQTLWAAPPQRAASR